MRVYVIAAMLVALSSAASAQMLDGDGLHIGTNASNGWTVQNDPVTTTHPGANFMPDRPGPMFIDILPRGTGPDATWGRTWLDLCSNPTTKPALCGGIHQYNGFHEYWVFPLNGRVPGRFRLRIFNGPTSTGGSIAIEVFPDGSVRIPKLNTGMAARAPGPDTIGIRLRGN